MRGIAALQGRAHAIALDGFHKNDGRAILALTGPTIRCIELFGILAASLDLRDLDIGEGIHELFQPGVTVHPMLTLFVSRKYRVALIVAVEALLHAMPQHPLVIRGEQRVPTTAPDHLQDLPVSAAKRPLQLLNDLAVTADRSVEALQIAVDDNHQIIEPFTGGDVDGAQHLRLIGLTVADKAPDPRVIGGQQSAMLQVLGEPRDIDRHGHGQAHGCVGDLPEFGHGSRMRVGGQTPALSQLTPEITQLLLGQPTFQIGPRVDTWRGVRLGKDEVSTTFCAENMMEGRLHGRGS